MVHKSSKELMFEMLMKIDPTFKPKLNEENDDKFIQKAIKHKGALHRELGIPEDKKIPMSLINKKIKEIQDKEKDGSKLSSEDRKFLKRLVLAKTLKSESTVLIKNKLNEDVSNNNSFVLDILEEIGQLSNEIREILSEKINEGTEIPKDIVDMLFKMHNELNFIEHRSNQLSESENIAQPIIRGKFQGE